ncbi:hypothetical protein [Aliarcobacter butzleri]|uniref:Uncharacterized protein n=1 Tax=Aliarcobacter butzleri L351 TaxID=1447259 RepID=A0A837J426_9BACT|nr:hypothetical protein [Aliarcobacter butzleri]KLE00248.1 hypothetical protein AF76_08250 [Aliarcobacter butzleri L351]KLE13266.1 hypothetical protein AF75_04570 [Aliarcobacter butzleri L350]MDN5073766.1 hypothetical protein [Aliarcobacter butzleri]MDN5122260.1 hypothetical protein [Aliarcobacter butzleri]
MNKKIIISIIIMIILCISYLIFEDYFKNGIKFLFEINCFLWIHTIAVIIVFFIHFVYKIETSSHLKILNNEVALFDTILNIGTFALIGSTALTLLKGIYLQHFFKIEYFRSFGELDLITIFAVCCALLWYTIVRIFGLFKEALYYQPQSIQS